MKAKVNVELYSNWSLFQRVKSEVPDFVFLTAMQKSKSPVAWLLPAKLSTGIYVAGCFLAVRDILGSLIHKTNYIINPPTCEQ